MKELVGGQKIIANSAVVLPIHGGDIIRAAKNYGIDDEQWIDLSTGVNPNAYPVPAIPLSVFAQLPYLQPAFLAAAQQYYQQSELVAVAGSQVAIQILPALLTQYGVEQVLLPDIGYQEHEQHWQEQSAVMSHYSALTEEAMVADIDRQLGVNPQQHVIIIRPNNPTAVSVSISQLLQWSEQLSAHAYLVVDEAFIDTAQDNSLLALDCMPNNLVVLRSFGKFFGLAGLRLGFVFAHQQLLTQLQRQIGLWSITGPTQFIATQALIDQQWQQQARIEIINNTRFMSELLAPMVTRFKLAQPLREHLFLAYPMALKMALALFEQFAEQGILTRVVKLSENKALLRFGLISRTDTSAVKYLSQAIDGLN
jgi:cobalamin biosynthetic protein CobC